DNDGMTDLAVSVASKVLLLHNGKDSKFKDIAQQAGVSSGFVTTGLNFIDYDHDGDLDLNLVGGTRTAMPLGKRGGITDVEVHAFPPQDLLWRNDGNGSFSNSTEAVGLSAAGYDGNSIGTDYNNDRAIDFVTSGGEPIIYENPREGRFHPKSFWEEYKPHSTLGMAGLDFD